MVVKPQRKDFERIAFLVVSQYNQSFADLVNGFVVGSGYESLTHQLLNRCENMKRKKLKFGEFQKESNASSSSNVHDQTSSSTQSDLQENITSINDDEVQEKKAFLQLEYTLSENSNRDKMLMAELHEYQKFLLQKNGSVKSILEEWPLLRNETFMFQYFDTEMKRSNSEQLFPKEFATKAHRTYK